MSLLLHISDTHFGTEQRHVMDALLALTHQKKPDVLVFSGDITQRARGAQFRAARKFCDELGVPRALALPGNHDIPLFNLAQRLLYPYAGYLAAFGPVLEPVLETPDILVIGVNTTRPARHKNGVVSQQQSQRVQQRLRAASRQQLRVVVTHHPADVLRAADAHDRLRGAEPALQAWSDAGADLVLGGHIHLPYLLDLRSRARPTPRAMWCLQAGTAISARVRFGTSNSVNLVLWETPASTARRRCGVERWDYDGSLQRFVCARTDDLSLAG